MIFYQRSTCFDPRIPGGSGEDANPKRASLDKNMQEGEHVAHNIHVACTISNNLIFVG